MRLLCLQVLIALFRARKRLPETYPTTTVRVKRVRRGKLPGQATITIKVDA